MESRTAAAFANLIWFLQNHWMQTKPVRESVLSNVAASITHERILKDLFYCFWRFLFLVEVISQHKKKNIVLFYSAWLGIWDQSLKECK